MSYLVLARKWRPQTFDDIAGQSHVTRTLQNAIRAGRVAHAYLFTGVRGVGKTTAARILAKALNCEKGPTTTPCNQCTQCSEITAGNSIDVLEIDGASNRGIDEIRQIIENVRYQPARCRFKIYIIDEVHQVTKDAFNALLKTLEEPPPSVKFILATTEPHRLPETILSRCQRFDFRRIPTREIVQRLNDIAEQEGVKVNQAALVLLAREADGSMRDAQSLLEQVLACAVPVDGTASTIDEPLLQDVLGLGARQLLYQVSDAVIRMDSKRCLELIAESAGQGRDLARLSRDLVEHFRNLLVARLSQEERRIEHGRPGLQSSVSSPLLDLADQEIKDLAAQATDLSIETLLDYVDFMSAGDEEVACSPNPRFALEAALVRLSLLPKSLPVAALVERLERLEAKLTTPGAQAAEPHFSESARATVPPGAERAGAPREEADDKNRRLWQDFVAFVGKQKKFLASHLASGSAFELSAGTLKIGVAERHHLRYLQDPDNLVALRSLASQFFSGEVMISVSALAAEPATSLGETTAGAAGGKTDARSEMVSEALRILGGSIRTVRREN
jgi:DNA polymerase-3 subunit gamma/tau